MERRGGGVGVCVCEDKSDEGGDRKMKVTSMNLNSYCGACFESLRK